MRLIDADKLKKSTCDKGVCSDCEDFHKGNNVSTNCSEVRWYFLEKINEQPTVEAQPVRHGKWIYGNDFHWYTASCNVCGYQRRTDIKADRWNQWNYCPNCGAKMDGDKHGTD